MLKYIERIKAMDQLIQMKATGTSEEFAEKLNISRSTLMEYIDVLKQMEAPIAFDRFRNSYYYLFPCRLKIGYEGKELSDSDLVEINKKNLEKFCEVLKVK